MEKSDFLKLMIILNLFNSLFNVNGQTISLLQFFLRQSTFSLISFPILALGQDVEFISIGSPYISQMSTIISFWNKLLGPKDRNR